MKLFSLSLVLVIGFFVLCCVLATSDVQYIERIESRTASGHVVRWYVCGSWVYESSSAADGSHQVTHVAISP